MPPVRWTTDEQLAFLKNEDLTWAAVKNGPNTLKSFYARVTAAFLEKWPAIPDKEIMEKAGGDSAKAQTMAEDKLHKVSIARNPGFFFFSYSVSQSIHNWFSNEHRQNKQAPPIPEPILDLSGKYSRKKPPLQPWQAFCSLYYRPRDSSLRPEAQSLFKRRNDPTAVKFLTDFFPPDTDIGATDYLPFLSAFLRERCTRLSRDEEEKVQAYIQEQDLMVTEQRDLPWSIDDDYDDDPLLAENRYIQK